MVSAYVRTSAAQAERYFAEDPGHLPDEAAPIGELLAQQLATRAGMFVGVDKVQSELLGRPKRDTA